jgi:signal transduction histidine kinase
MRTTGRIRLFRSQYAYIPPDTVIVYTDDITDRRRTEEALRRAERLATTGHLAASVAHEINNPLMAIASCLALVEMEMPENSKQHRNIKAIKGEIKRIAAIVHQVFDLYGMDTHRPQRFSAGKVIREMIRMMRPQAKRWGLALSHSISKEIPRVRLPKGELKQVLYNVVYNAMEASPQGGTVEISCMPEPPWIRIDVADQGKGIPEEILPRIFDPFFTTKKHPGAGPGGMGLGLSISRDLVGSFGGKIDVKPNHPHGTVFTIFLPSPA